MCGVVGILAAQCEFDGVTRERLVTMADKIRHRGPDDMGYWIDADANIALGHRRLAIIDLSQAGHQPMNSVCGRYVLVFNGEIYNHLALRKELERDVLAPRWRGHSDTETLLAGFSIWGVRATVERSIGMFAFALWDRQRQELQLARDRLGEKPLYYGWLGKGARTVFLFGSELKVLQAHPAFDAEIDRGAVSLLMRHSYVPAPHSIYCGVNKLMPGTILTVSLAQPSPKIEAYWSIAAVACRGVAEPFDGTSGDAVDALEATLNSAIGQQMVADVPLGAFLSGGIDSSTVVALMQAQSRQAVKTFTIGFDEAGYNEAVHAKAVARHLGTDHTELYVTSQQARDLIPELPNLYCEPFSDASQIPTSLVSRLAHGSVTVSLSGDGGDELFGGYNRYVVANRLWGKLSRIPKPIRRFGAHTIQSIPPETWNKLLGSIPQLLSGGFRQAHLGEKLHKGASVLAVTTLDELYRGLVSHWDPAQLVLGASEPPTFLTGNTPELRGLDDVQHMMALDTLSYLPDDILVKVDRATMGVSLEGRIPLLDHRVVELAWRLPQSLKLRDGVGKWVLRQVLYRHVPKALVERPKMGFAVPIDTWLRGPLRAWAEALLDERRLADEGFFDSTLIRSRWQEHLSGRRNWQYHLWDVLMFQAWLAEQ